MLLLGGLVYGTPVPGNIPLCSETRAWKLRMVSEYITANSPQNG